LRAGVCYDVWLVCGSLGNQVCVAHGFDHGAGVARYAVSHACLEIERLASRKMFPASRIMPADVTAFSLHCLAAPTTSTVLSYSP